MARRLRARVYMLDVTVYEKHGKPIALVEWLTSRPDTKQLIDTVKNLVAGTSVVPERVTVRLVPIDVDIVVVEGVENEEKT